MSDINNFLNLNNFSHKKFLIFGDEPALVVKVKKHILADEDLRMIEKVYLNLEDQNFDELFNQALLSNSLFNENKVIFVSLKKNRLNKDLIASFKRISEINTEYIILIEIENISKKIIYKDIIPIFELNTHIAECSVTSSKDVVNFLKMNLPEKVNNVENINNLVKLYEGNFSLLINDLEVLKVLDLKNERDILNIFNDNGIKESSRLIEHISKREAKLAMQILESMKNNDRNSIGLLIWILARDCQALNALKESNNNLRSFNIWNNQVKWYNEIAKRISIQQIKSSIENLDKADKALKGIIDGDPWRNAKDVVLELSA